MRTYTLTEKCGEFSSTWTVDERPGFRTIWHTGPPAMGAAYQVLEDEWTEDDAGNQVRHIHEWSPA